MKAISIFLTAILFLAASLVIACTGGRKSSESLLTGSYIMKTIERNVDETLSMTDAGRDTTFNSLFRALSYMPDNTEWNFADNSVLIVTKTGNDDFKPDTVVYKISSKGDTLLIMSADFVEKFPLKKLDADHFELDLGDPTVSYQLIRKP